jgi:predicted metal-dependent hydrolase
MNEDQIRNFMTHEARKTNGASVGIPARLMDFPLPEGSRRFPFFGGNALSSSLFAVFSTIFPPGERFFVESVRRFRDAPQDPVTQAQISGFIGQEAIHGREHEHLNEWFRAQGYDLDMPDRMIRFSLGLLEKLSPSQQLACTSFMEHFTAHLAEQWLTHEEFRRTTDPQMIKLWYWHAIEELEHKSVAFDLHAQISASPYRERMLAVPLVAAALVPGILISWLWLVAKHGELLSMRENRRGLTSLLGRNGFIRNVLVRAPDYLGRDFHPSHQETQALEREWREKLFGGQGELNAYFRNREAVQKAAAVTA